MKRIRTSNLLPVIILIMVFVGGMFVYYKQYCNIKSIIKSEYDAKSKLVEESIYNETKYTDIISKIAETDFDSDMESYSNLMINKYKQDSDIYSWDLEEMKKQYSGMDIHIINKDLEIIRSTVPEDVGINFTEYKDFAKTLNERLYNNKFVTDSINSSIRTNKLKKYSYISTHDNKYILELSIGVEDKYPELEKLNIVYLSENLSKKYTFVKDIRIYKYSDDKKNFRELNASKESDQRHEYLNVNKNDLIQNALSRNKVQEQTIINENNNSYTLKYIPYSTYNEKNELNWWDSYVIEVLYDDQVMLNDISKQKTLFLRTMLILSIIYFSLSYIILRLLEKNKRMAYEDYLTKLPNRNKFEEVTKSKISCPSRKNNRFAILFFDLDKFKKINDTLGHSVGDEVLKQAGERIKSKISKKDILSRFGGDEFAAIFSKFETQEQIDKLSEDILESFDKPLIIGSHKVFIKPSIGISMYPDHGTTFEELIDKADKAMYEAKQNDLEYKIYDEVHI